MENSQLKDLLEEVSEATKQYILTTFNSENGMKTYYLQMSNIIRSAHINPPIDTEYNSLKKLSKKLKQYCTFKGVVRRQRGCRAIGHLEIFVRCKSWAKSPTRTSRRWS